MGLTPRPPSRSGKGEWQTTNITPAGSPARIMKGTGFGPSSPPSRAGKGPGVRPVVCLDGGGHLVLYCGDWWGRAGRRSEAGAGG
jgi:hypothetical protein